jgi:cobalamin biosynthesis Mg chelatase CobN
MGILEYADKPFIFNNIDCISRDADEVYEFPRQAFYEDYLFGSGSDDTDSDNPEVGGDSPTVGSDGSDEERAEEEPSPAPAESESDGDGESETESESETKTETESESESETETGTESESESETETGTESESESETETGTETGTESESESGTEPVLDFNGGSDTPLPDSVSIGDYSEILADIYTEGQTVNSNLETVHGDLQVISCFIVVFLVIILLQYVYKFFKIFF